MNFRKNHYFMLFNGFINERRHSENYFSYLIENFNKNKNLNILLICGKVKLLSNK